MAILKRRTESLKVICSLDPALKNVPDKVMKKYLLTRDISVLGNLDELAEKPTVFTVLPIRSGKEYLLENALDSMMAKAELVRTHVTAISGFDVSLVDDSGIQVISDDTVKSLPIEVVGELATVIIEAQSRGENQLGFFSQQGTWQQVRRDTKLLAHLA